MGGMCEDVIAKAMDVLRIGNRELSEEVMVNGGIIDQMERFYRVDKSHSRQSGWTGLGVSIVKHVVQCHHGKIRVESEQGKGTTIEAIISRNNL